MKSMLVQPQKNQRFQGQGVGRTLFYDCYRKKFDTQNKTVKETRNFLDKPLKAILVIPMHEKWQSNLSRARITVIHNK